MTQVITNDVSAIQPRQKFGLTKSSLIDLNPETGTRAKQNFLEKLCP